MDGELKKMMPNMQDNIIKMDEVNGNFLIQKVRELVH
jgi:hypothetical protein